MSAGEPPPVVTLLTDFGLEDTYVGVMKGVIVGLRSDIRIVDLTHAVPPQDIRAAAFHLAAAAGYFPRGTVHAVVVDPGVGGERRAIAVQSERAFYVAPDNGVLTLALRDDRPRVVVHLNRPEFWLPRVSRTFHGRDIFAPVAAALACGRPIRELGAEINDLATLPIPEAQRRADGGIEGRVQHVDRFGNCITDLPSALCADVAEPTFDTGKVTIRGLSPSYDAVNEGEPLALAGSTCYVEIAVGRGNAARTLGLKVGDPIVCRC